MLFMKLSADTEAGLPLWKRKRGAIGFVFLVGNSAVIDVIVFGLLPLSVIAPFAGLTIVFSLLLASVGCLGQEKEPLRWIDGLYVGLVLLGVTIVSLFGPHGDGEHVGFEEILVHFGSPLFVVYAVLSLSIVATWLAISCVPSLRQYKPSGTGRKAMAATALSAYAAATCGALSQLFLKVVATGMGESASCSCRGPFKSWQIYVALVCLATCAPLQLYLLGKTRAG